MGRKGSAPVVMKTGADPERWSMSLFALVLIVVVALVTLALVADQIGRPQTDDLMRELGRILPGWPWW